MRGSLQLRLSLAAAALIALALALAGAGLVVIADRMLDSRASDELDVMAKFLAGQVRRTADGALSLSSEPADPRYDRPYGGLYWQIASPTAELRSRSLWDKRLELPGTLPEPPAALDLAGPDGGTVIAVARHVAIGREGAQTPLTIVAAIDRRDLSAARSAYLRLLVPSLLALGAVLALAMSIFVRRALLPFRQLRHDLRAMHEGMRTRLPDHFPEEVQPLVNDLNRLIGAQERALQRAQSQAGDMAHGLKTPLAVLTALARRHQGERPQLSAEIEEQALAMSRQVERVLVRARLSAAGDLRRHASPLRPAIERLVATLKRLPEADSLVWEIDVPAALTFPGEEGDLTEMLGNLLDNARKWAHRRVQVRARAEGPGAWLSIEDDGPGMSADAISQIARGRRWDETKPGTGFGVAISGDIAEELGARMEVGRSDLGGLRVTIAWGDRV